MSFAVTAPAGLLRWWLPSHEGCEHQEAGDEKRDVHSASEWWRALWPELSEQCEDVDDQQHGKDLAWRHGVSATSFGSRWHGQWCG